MAVSASSGPRGTLSYEIQCGGRVDALRSDPLHTTQVENPPKFISHASALVSRCILKTKTETCPSCGHYALCFGGLVNGVKIFLRATIRALP